MYNYAPDMVLHMVCIIMPGTIDMVSMNVESRWVELSDRTIHFDVVCLVRTVVLVDRGVLGCLAPADRS
jgi:hypothetical protein